jgi:hypothetical protein
MAPRKKSMTQGVMNNGTCRLECYLPHKQECCNLMYERKWVANNNQFHHTNPHYICNIDKA